MKTKILKVLGLLSLALALSCQKTEISEEAPVKENTAGSTSKAAVACPNVYALVLSSGGVGTPVSASQSFLFKVDLCSSPVGYNFTSQIKIGATPVLGVTGICDLPGVVDYLYAVTGVNSNFPKSLLKVKISTGQAFFVTNTTNYVQDIQNISSTYFVAIKEATSQLMSVNVGTGFCTAISPLGPTSQYNGLTLVGGKLHAISGNTSSICSPRFGDIFEYNITGGSYIAKYSYKATSSLFTTKELGFYFDECCGKRWVVGSSQGIISNNTSITPCVLPNASFLLNASTSGQNYWNIYDFAAKP